MTTPSSAPPLTVRDWLTKVLDSPASWLLNPPGAAAPVPPLEPPVEPPVEPPTEPPIEPPIEPPVEPPTEPPVVPPVEPPPVEPPPVDPPVEPPPVEPPTVPSPDRHWYFDYLTKRNDFYKGYSLRPKVSEPISSPYYEKQLLRRGLGGFAVSNSNPLAVTYDPVMDSAKVVIPPFVAGFGNPPLKLVLPMLATDATATVNASNFDRTSRRQFKIDDEIVTLTETAPKPVNGEPVTMKVSRGTFGTTITDHAAGTELQASTNGLPNPVFLPLALSGDHDWLITWEAMYADSWKRSISGIAGNKTFQITARKSPDGGAGTWFEVKTRVDLAPTPADIGLVGLRGYSIPQGTNVTNQTTLTPVAGKFVLKPYMKTRYWLLIEQRTGGWDHVSLWVADEQTAPVKLVDRLEFESHDMVSEFWIEGDDSQYFLGVNRPDMVMWVDDVAVLRDPQDLEALLIRPGKVA